MLPLPEPLVPSSVQSDLPMFKVLEFLGLGVLVCHLKDRVTE